MIMYYDHTSQGFLLDAYVLTLTLKAYAAFITVLI